MARQQRMTAEDFALLRRWFRAGALTDTALEDIRSDADAEARFDHIDAWLKKRYVQLGGWVPFCGTLDLIELDTRARVWDQARQAADKDDRDDQDDKEDRLPDGVIT